MLKTDETKKDKKRGKNIEMVLKNSGQKLGQKTTKSGNTVPVTQKMSNKIGNKIGKSMRLVQCAFKDRIQTGTVSVSARFSPSKIQS